MEKREGLLRGDGFPDAWLHNPIAGLASIEIREYVIVAQREHVAWIVILVRRSAERADRPVRRQDNWVNWPFLVTEALARSG